MDFWYYVYTGMIKVRVQIISNIIVQNKGLVPGAELTGRVRLLVFSV